MIILRQKEYTRFEPNYDFVSSLEGIAKQANRQFPKEVNVGMEVVYRPGSVMGIRAEIILSLGERDAVHVQIMRDGRIISDSRKMYNVPKLRNLLLEAIDKLISENVPGTENKLEFLKAQITTLK